MRGTLHFDGGGQAPGPISFAFVLERPGCKPIERANTRATGTNNTAEYHALVTGLAAAFDAGVTHLDIVGDSKLVVEQVNDRWRVRHAGLVGLHSEALWWLAKFESWTLRHAPRELNTRADLLARRALEGRLAVEAA